jgi:hypothetical protein
MSVRWSAILDRRAGCRNGQTKTIKVMVTTGTVQHAPFTAYVTTKTLVPAKVIKVLVSRHPKIPPVK